MGRKSKLKILNIWMNGNAVGKWQISSSGTHEFNYEESWLNSTLCRSISLSMPLKPSEQKHKGAIVESFFDNLLPDSLSIRKRIQTRFHKETNNAFDLLEEIGRDCVGALQLLPPDVVDPDVYAIKGRPVDEKKIEKILRSVSSQNRYNDINDDFRISMAGAQEKTAFLFHDNKWKIPQGATPSTHIFKLPIGPLESVDMSTSVENEWLCSKIIEAFGLPIAKTEMAQFGSQQVLIIERFDRKISNDAKWIMRIPQEDMCQATGTSSGLKYESDGGPGIKDIMNILLGSSNLEIDRIKFFKSQILFWLLAAPDGHSKNFSIFLDQGDRFFLTPLYDVLSAYPIIGKSQNKIPIQKLKMAMSVYGNNKHYHWNRIKYQHWFQTGKQNGLPEKVVKDILEEILELSPTVIDTVTKKIPKGFPGNVLESIIKGMNDALKALFYKKIK